MEILISIAIGAALMELYVWLDPICKHLIGWAAKKLPAGREEEFQAQWEADLATVPNSIFKLYFVLRDCILPIRDIEQIMFREEFAELADSMDGIIDLNRLARLELRSSAVLARSESMTSRLISTLDNGLQRIHKLRGDDAGGRSAIERCNVLRPTLLVKLSEFHAAIKGNHDAMLQAAMVLREKLGDVVAIQSRLRARLLDSTPLTDDDGDLILLLDPAMDNLLEALDSFGNSVRSYPVSSSDMLSSVKETCEAFAAAASLIKRN